MIVKQSVAVDVFVDLLIKLNPILASRQMRSLCDDMRPRLSRLPTCCLSESIQVLQKRSFVYCPFTISLAQRPQQHPLFQGEFEFVVYFRTYYLVKYLPSMFIPIYIFLKQIPSSKIKQLSRYNYSFIKHNCVFFSDQTLSMNMAKLKKIFDENDDDNDDLYAKKNKISCRRL